MFPVCSKLVIDPINDSLANQIKAMKVSKLSLWTPGTTLPLVTCDRLCRDQLVNLSVPEGQYGFATQPGAPVEQIAVVTEAVPTPATAATGFAAAEPRAAMLPATADAPPWVALGGLLSLFGAVGMRLGRKS